MKGNDGFYLMGYHVVCLIDVLGQKGKIRRWGDLPSNGQLTPDLIEALKQTVGVVLGFRDHFIEFFNLAATCTMPAKLASLPAKERERYRRFKDCKLNVQRFSDTFVFYSLVPNAYGDASVVPLYRALGACCMAMAASLSSKTPMRGAISIGPGMELEDRSFYGPALAEVHHLESEVAGYPRIVVSDAVRQFLAQGQVYSEDTEIDNLMQRMAATCRSLLCIDTDRHLIVDFLGRGMRDLLGSGTHVPDAIRSAHEFVRAEAMRFRASGESKLASRYELLQQYMAPRLPIWGLPQTDTSA